MVQIETASMNEEFGNSTEYDSYDYSYNYEEEAELNYVQLVVKTIHGFDL